MGTPRHTVEVRELEKIFRAPWPRRHRQVALRGVSFAVPEGAIFGILGPNGAGKTTLLSILATLLLPDRGEARVLGLDVVRDARRLRERINMASGSTSFLWSLTPREVLDVTGRTYGLARAARARRVAALLEQFELAAFADVPYNELSTGLRQRLALAKAFVNDPELLILDEPTVGLDPDVAVRVREEIAALRRVRGMTILLSTHYMREAEQLCDDIAFLRNGAILARGDAQSLKRQIFMGDRILLSVEGEGWTGIGRLPGVLAVRSEVSRVEALVDDARKRLPEILRHLMEQGVPVTDVSVAEPSLESVFIELAR
ncbi:MAG TPA: ABC transporter ATP-binding protein [Methylomirabilota bacterium]|nr:ABC transporter ATP-binding protein [Methylomirabilota bacterium]